MQSLKSVCFLAVLLPLTSQVMGQDSISRGELALQIAPKPLKKVNTIPLTKKGEDPLQDKVFPKGPDDEVWDATSYIFQIQTQESASGLITDPHNSVASRIRFLSFYNYPVKATRLGKKGEQEEYSPLAEALTYINKAVNDVNFKNPAFAVTPISDTLVAVSLDSAGWSDAAWNTMAAKDPYFRREWVNSSNWDYLN